MKEIFDDLTQTHEEVVSVKKNVVTSQQLLTQQSTLLAHINEQVKQCETRLSLIKTNTGLEVRRARRDHADLQVYSNADSSWHMSIIYL